VDEPEAVAEGEPSIQSVTTLYIKNLAFSTTQERPDTVSQIQTIQTTYCYSAKSYSEITNSDPLPSIAELSMDSDPE